jgi:hypothetical protein
MDSVETGSPVLPTDMEAIYRQTLDRAQTLANQEKFASAIAKVAGIPKNSRHFSLARRLQVDWSQALLEQAIQHYQTANLDAAKIMLAAIPEDSPIHAQGVELRSQWQSQQQQLQRAIAAQQAHDWQGVIDALQPLADTPLQHSSTVQDLWKQAIAAQYEPDPMLLQMATMDLPAEAL